jgi:hypothetical protein
VSAERPRPTIRLTDAERENAVALLVAAHGEGRISLDELDERLGAAYRATIVGDLEPLLADVPDDHERQLLARPPGDVVELLAGPGGVIREGSWRVPRRLLIDHHRRAWPQGGSGEVTLDFRTAEIPHPEVDIELRVLGPAQLVLPAGGTADLRGVRGAGPPARTAVPCLPNPGKVHLVVHGIVVRRRAVRVGYRRRPGWTGTLTM